MSKTVPAPQPQGPILVVDDDAVLREFICLALSEQGYTAIGAANGIEALAVAAANRPALVLMDVGIPLLNGRDLVVRLEELCGGLVPCIVMSGSRPEAEMLNAECVRGYLAKPFDIDRLFELVKEHTTEPEPFVMQ